jgi:hypothetical protein
MKMPKNRTLKNGYSDAREVSYRDIKHTHTHTVNAAIKEKGEEERW